MDNNTRLRLKKQESGSIRKGDINGSASKIIVPAPQRRIHQEAVFADISLTTKGILEMFRNRVMSGQRLDQQDMRSFRDIAELALKQTKVEMDWEKSNDTSHLSDEELAAHIEEQLKEEGMGSEGISAFLKAAGLKK